MKLVKESQSSKKVLRAINSTFIPLIPKKHKYESFDDFRPILYCNMVYKIIAKTIAHRMKPTLSKIIYEEQFGFLFTRQIHDAISLAKEAIHSIKKGKTMCFHIQARSLQSLWQGKLDIYKIIDVPNWHVDSSGMDIEMHLINLFYSVDKWCSFPFF